MSELDPALATALQGPRVLLFGAIEMQLPGGTVRLVDGAAEVPIAGEVFVGRDAAWGVLDTIKGLGDSVGDRAPVISIGLIPASNAAMADLLDPAIQGSPVTVMIGAIDMATGLPIGTPYVPFSGEADVPTVTWDKSDRRIELKCTGIGDRLYEIEEGVRLSNTFHQMVWPGELGLEFVTGVEDWVPWGQQLDLSGPQIRTDRNVSAGTGAYGGYTGGGVLSRFGNAVAAVF